MKMCVDDASYRVAWKMNLFCIALLLYDKREYSLDYLRYLLITYNWSTIKRLTQIDDIYNLFLSIVKKLILVA